MDGESRIDFTAVVVCYNEADKLRDCLASLEFCGEAIVVDLGSSDRSLAVADEFGATILQHERVPIRNRPLHYGISKAKFEWVVALDPDEVFPKGEIAKIEAVILENPDLDGIRIPWQYYFKGKPLTRTHWGRKRKSKCVVVQRDRIKGTPFIHEEFKQDGKKYAQNIYTFTRESMQPLRHNWLTSYRGFFATQWRYAKAEGERKHHAGLKFSREELWQATRESLHVDLVKHKGLRGGFTGIFLSVSRAGFVALGWLVLRQIERRAPVPSCTNPGN